MSTYPEWFIQLIQTLPSKRSRIVAEHIVAHGLVTTEELSTLYGYQHPPRAARDLREAGLPLETLRVKNADGRSIAAYRFGAITPSQNQIPHRRINFSKAFKQALLDLQGSQCAICPSLFEPRYLQIDHRIPYPIQPDSTAEPHHISNFMLVCATCNRAKGWSCQNCPNMQSDRTPSVCQNCYWAQPSTHTHVATQPIRRVDLVWEGIETTQYEILQQQAAHLAIPITTYIKELIAKWLT